MPKSKKFNTEVLKRRNLQNAKQTTLKINDTKGHIKYSEIKGIISTFENSAGNARTFVRIPAPVGVRTLKGYYTELNEDDFIDHFSNRVANASKFTSDVEYVEIIVFKEYDANDYFS